MDFQSQNRKMYTFGFIAAGIWELLRFAYLALTVTTQWSFYFESFTLVILLWFGVGQLSISAGFILIPFYPVKSFLVKRLCLLGKILQGIPGILIVVLFIGDNKFLFSIPPFFILFIDFLLILFLVSYRSPPDREEEENRTFPGYTETILEED